jgi:hypothetical protein
VYPMLAGSLDCPFWSNVHHNKELRT